MMTSLKRKQRKWCFESLLQDSIVASQFAVFFALGIVISVTVSNIFSTTSEIYGTTSSIRADRIRSSKTRTEPMLHDLLVTIVDEFDKLNITHWLMPGTQLLPSKPIRTGLMASGKLSPWQEGIDLGVMSKDQIQVLLAQSRIQSYGITTVESYFGMRFFSIYGKYDDRYDFRTPFVDVFFFDTDDDYIVNPCCDCGPVQISACTKKTCGCLLCASKARDIFPIVPIRIAGCQRSIAAPNNIELVFLSQHNKDVHPSLFMPARSEFT